MMGQGGPPTRRAREGSFACAFGLGIYNKVAAHDSHVCAQNINSHWYSFTVYIS
jgi:hypothetical protein